MQQTCWSYQSDTCLGLQKWQSARHSSWVVLGLVGSHIVQPCFKDMGPQFSMHLKLGRGNKRKLQAGRQKHLWGENYYKQLASRQNCELPQFCCLQVCLKANHVHWATKPMPWCAFPLVAAWGGISQNPFGNNRVDSTDYAEPDGKLPW